MPSTVLRAATELISRNTGRLEKPMPQGPPLANAAKEASQNQAIGVRGFFDSSEEVLALSSSSPLPCVGRCVGPAQVR